MDIHGAFLQEVQSPPDRDPMLFLVNWNTAGPQTVSVNYTNGNSCLAASSTVRNITVNPLPSAAGAISGSPNVCQGQNTSDLFGTGDT